MIRPVLAEGEAPAARAAVCLVSGIFLGSWSGEGTFAAVALAAMSLAAMGLLDRLGPRRGVAGRLAFLAFWSCAGFSIARERIAAPGQQAEREFQRLPGSPERADLIEGVLKDFWSGRPPRARTTLRADRLRSGAQWRPFRAEVVVFVSGETPVEPVADRGDRVRMTGHLEPEELPVSDREIGLPWPRFRLSVKTARLVEKRGSTLLSLLTLPNRRLFAALEAQGGGSPAFERDVRGPLAALLLGRTSELDRGMVARYRRGGLYHLLVVSGLHVVMAAGLVLFFLRMLGIEGKPRDCLLLLSVSLFVLVGGANPPAVRAGLVVMIFLVTRLLERPITSAQAIGLSAILLFVAAPAEIFSVGTVLTFAAVAGIALFAKPIRGWLPERPEWLFSSLAVALAAECATAPVLFWRFNLVAAGAWVTAPLSIPLSGALIGLGGVLLVCDAVGLPACPLTALFAIGARWLERLAERAAGMAFLRPTPPLGLVCLVGGLLLAAVFAPRRIRRLAAIGAAALFFLLAVRRGPYGPRLGFSIEALDVGQGDAILLRWRRRAILVDGGGPFDLAATDFGRTRLLPKLLDRGVTRLDAVLLTHPHPDHALGLFAVLEELPVGQLLRSAGEDEGELYARLEATAAERRVSVRMLTAGDAIILDGARLLVLASGGFRRKNDAINNQSVVALFERDGRAALLTGDAGIPTEMDLLHAGALSPADVLKVGHHGSRTSTSAEFVGVLRPRIALLSCGRRNRFGHPAPQTLATLERFCVLVLRTDLRSDSRIELEPGRTRLTWRGGARP
ncbi:MAG TPA: DNA internalization-related competence protein ComEC/Rec2 [Thermoanaerobaculia bacterium]